MKSLAPQVGFEPTTLRLTEGLSGFFVVATGCYKALRISRLQSFLRVSFDVAFLLFCYLF
jgi:hypothetical protein